MMQATEQPAMLTKPQFERLNRIMNERSGIRLQANAKHALGSRLCLRLGELGIDDFDQYIAFLTMGPYQNDEFEEMFSRLRLNETGFFRDEPQLDAFENIILPRMLDKRSETKRLRIWSAACSTGEEAYTLAIQLHRSLGEQFDDWQLDILGTDISEKCLKAATSGRYTGTAVDSMPESARDRYFTNNDGFFDVDPVIQSIVNVEKHNLKDTVAARHRGQWDVIFCRNVMADLDDETKDRATQMFHDQLADDGYLFIGRSETLEPCGAPFECAPIPQGFCYHKA